MKVDAYWGSLFPLLTEVRSQRSDGRRRRTEDRRLMSEVRGVVSGFGSYKYQISNTKKVTMTKIQNLKLVGREIHPYESI